MKTTNFKAWDYLNNKWLDTSFLLLDDNNNIFIRGAKNWQNDIRNNKGGYDTTEYTELMPIHHVNICRFIGQYDSTGRAIYEGDLYFLGNKKETIRIIEYSNYIHYSKPMCGFNLNINELYACFSSKDYYPIYNKQATYSIYDNLIIIGSKFDTDVEKIYKEAQNEKKE
ncbi:MAG TPA: YopX family protein [Bacteroidia bacterium]|nr:YopX family protein [Bacteroidia bacterium]